MNASRLIRWSLVGPVLLTHLTVSVMLFGLVFGLREGDGAPTLLIVTQQILSAPLFLLPDRLLDTVGHGLGAAGLLTLFGLNSAIWGIAISAIFGLTAERPERRE